MSEKPWVSEDGTKCFAVWKKTAGKYYMQKEQESRAEYQSKLAAFMREAAAARAAREAKVRAYFAQLAKSA
tara:strand:+ start:413 stop:625 length:213 start_codon:yes stop_codon:yes gene_type:complete